MSGETTLNDQEPGNRLDAVLGRIDKVMRMAWLIGAAVVAMAAAWTQTMMRIGHLESENALRKADLLAVIQSRDNRELLADSRYNEMVAKLTAIQSKQEVQAERMEWIKEKLK